MIYKQFVGIIFIIFIFGAIAWCYLRNRIYEIESDVRRFHKMKVEWVADSRIESLWEEIHRIKSEIERLKITYCGGLESRVMIYVGKDGIDIEPFESMNIPSSASKDKFMGTSMKGLLEAILESYDEVDIVPGTECKLELKVKK